MRRRIWILIEKNWVTSLPQIKGITVGVIVWSSIDVIKGVGFFNGKVFK